MCSADRIMVWCAATVVLATATGAKGCCLLATAMGVVEYTYDSFPTAWFGAYSTGWETEAQLEQLGRYQMVALIGFFGLLTKNNYTHEGAALIEQSHVVKQRT